MTTLAALVGSCRSLTRVRLADLAAMTKPRLNLLVLLATAAGFYLGAPGSVAFSPLAFTLLGTFLVASGASVLNQVREREADGRMRRTLERPLPTGRVLPGEAWVLGWLLAVTGTCTLALTANQKAAGLAVLTLVLYLFLYTPLKRRTPLNTLVGAFPGALPPLIGWAASGRLDAAAGTLFAIVFLWQMPHFLAIAWLYRHDYALGGFKMLPVVEPGGRGTGWRVVLYAGALVPIVWTPTLFGLTGSYYAAGSVALTLAFLGFAIHFAWNRSDVAARRLFLASIIYLPLLLGLMILDKSRGNL